MYSLNRRRRNPDEVLQEQKRKVIAEPSNLQEVERLAVMLRRAGEGVGFTARVGDVFYLLTETDGYGDNHYRAFPSEKDAVRAYVIEIIRNIDGINDMVMVMRVDSSGETILLPAHRFGSINIGLRRPVAWSALYNRFKNLFENQQFPEIMTLWRDFYSHSGVVPEQFQSWYIIRSVTVE